MHSVVKKMSHKEMTQRAIVSRVNVAVGQYGQFVGREVVWFVWPSPLENVSVCKCGKVEGVSYRKGGTGGPCGLPLRQETRTAPWATVSVLLHLLVHFGPGTITLISSDQILKQSMLKHRWYCIGLDHYPK